MYMTVGTEGSVTEMLFVKVYFPCVMSEAYVQSGLFPTVLGVVKLYNFLNRIVLQRDSSV